MRPMLATAEALLRQGRTGEGLYVLYGVLPEYAGSWWWKKPTGRFVARVAGKGAMRWGNGAGFTPVLAVEAALNDYLNG